MAASASDAFHATKFSAISGKRPILVPGDDVTLVDDDCGAIVFMLVAGDVQLPKIADVGPGWWVTVINEGADGAVEVGVSPNAADAIIGEIANSVQDSQPAGTTGFDLVNTEATMILGDRVTIVSDGGTMWYVIEGVGVWETDS